jgi:hypothetical protein
MLFSIFFWSFYLDFFGRGPQGVGCGVVENRAAQYSVIFIDSFFFILGPILKCVGFIVEDGLKILFGKFALSKPVEATNF